jgi:hypothetical protein
MCSSLIANVDQLPRDAHVVGAARLGQRLEPEIAACAPFCPANSFLRNAGVFECRNEIGVSRTTKSGNASAQRRCDEYRKATANRIIVGSSAKLVLFLTASPTRSGPSARPSGTRVGISNWETYSRPIKALEKHERCVQQSSPAAAPGSARP